MTAPTPPPAPRPQGRHSRWGHLRRLPAALMLACVLAGLGIVQLTFQLGNLAYRTLTWQADTRATQTRIEGLERDVRVLREAERGAQDPAYLEILARCQGFVGEGEQVVVALDAPETPGENCDTLRLP